MDERLRQLIDALPERPPRSKLEPHAEVIRELRKKRRTYQEIATFFREHLQLTVAPSTIYEFVKTRARQARNRRAGMPELPASTAPLAPEKMTAESPKTEATSPAKDDVRERIRSVRKQPVFATSERRSFEYDPQEPLTLNPKSKEK